MNDSELVLEEYEVEVKGLTYSVKPLPLKSIISNEFLNDRLIAPHGAPIEMQTSNIADNDKRKSLDKWVRRLVTLNGKEMSLTELSESGFNISDLARLLEKIAEVSGISEQKESATGENNNNWAFLFGTLMSGRTMTKAEVMEASLPFLNAMVKEIIEIRSMTMGLGLGGMSGRSTTPSAKTCTSREEFLGMANG